MSTNKPKSFWSKPEGVTGAIFLLAIILGAGYLVSSFLGGIIALAFSRYGRFISCSGRCNFYGAGWQNKSTDFIHV